MTVYLGERPDHFAGLNFDGRPFVGPVALIHFSVA